MGPVESLRVPLQVLSLTVMIPALYVLFIKRSVQINAKKDTKHLFTVLRALLG